MEATGPNTEINGVAPASMVMGGVGGVNYHFTISRDLVRVIRDNLLPFVRVDVTAGVDHVYRIELNNVAQKAEYALFVENNLEDQGVAEGEFPSFNPVIAWRSFVWDDDSQSRWDYVRYGRTPDPQSADFDSNGVVDEADVCFIEECIARRAAGEPAIPSCIWADVANSDNSVTCDDWHLIASSMWTGPGEPPEIAACPLDPIPAVSDWGMGVLGLLMVTLATVVYRNSLGHRPSFIRAN